MLVGERSVCLRMRFLSTQDLPLQRTSRYAPTGARTERLTSFVQRGDTFQFPRTIALKDARGNAGSAGTFVSESTIRTGAPASSAVHGLAAPSMSRDTAPERSTT